MRSPLLVLADRLAHWAVAHPRWVVAFTLIYLISPFDLVPEALVGPVGYLDDFVVVLLPLVARAYVKRRAADPRSSAPGKIDSCDRRSLCLQTDSRIGRSPTLVGSWPSP